MKKRSKIIVSIVASVMCLGFFVFGVYAAIRATFGLSASFNFDAKGVYVGVSGQVYTGTSTAPADLTALSGSDYKLSERINFTPLTDGSGLPDESKSFSSIAKWQPGNVSMDEDAPYLVYAVTFKNYSSKQICVTPTNSTAATDGVTMTENKSGLSSIASGSSKTYKLILQVTNVLIELNEKPISVSFTMQQTDEEPAPSSESYFLFDETTGQITGMNTETYTAETAPETLTIPATINEIEVKSLKAGTTSNPAFVLQSNTKNLVIEAAVDNIPDSCFQGCSSLVSITLPEGVASIGDYTFAGCTSLTSITILSSVTSIGRAAFSSCSSLMITVDEENANYSSLGGSLYNKDKTELIRGAGKVIIDDIPSSVTNINSFAFRGSASLTSITIPSRVTHIESSAFNGCKSLATATIDGQDVVNMLTRSSGAGLLLLRSSLKTVYIKSGLDMTNATYLTSNFTKQASSDKSGYDKYVKYSPDETYFLFDETTGQITGMNTETYTVATAPETLTIPATINGVDVKSLKAGTYSSSAFKLQSNTKNVIIEAAIDVIPDFCFESCSSLTSITIPSSVKRIGTYAFSGCTSLTSITIPSGVEDIWSYVFQGCTSLSSISLPSSLKSIGTGAIGNDIPFVRNLTADENGLKIVASSDDPNYKILIGSASGISNVDITEKMLEGVKVINSRAFGQSNSPRSIAIPDGVVEIPSDMAQNCTKLISISIPSSVTSIRAHAFAGCTLLTSINIPSGVISIADYAFNGCSSLMITVDEGNANYSSLGGSLYNKNKTELIRGAGKAIIDDIPSSVTRISSYAFDGCTALTSITIPSSVTSIGNHVFSGCSSLIITVDEANANYSSLDGSLYNKSKTELIRAAAKSVVDIPSSVTSIRESAFSDCTSLTSITIPSGVTNIGVLAFSRCTSLATVTIEGQNVVNMLTSSSGAGQLLYNSATKTVYIKSGLDMTKATYLASSFTKQSPSDKTGYDMWTR